MERVVFLDRDGTIIEDGPFLSNPEGIRFMEGALEALRRLRRHGFGLIVITNQSGVGRGYFSEEKLQEIHERLRSLMEKQGVPLEAIYYCPHSPEAGCACRKPLPWLFEKAIKEFSVDRAHSYSIGDKIEDAQAAKQAGCKTVFLGKNDLRKEDVVDFQASDLSSSVEWILKDAGLLA